jgi:putative mRNA 3-end processing factor
LGGARVSNNGGIQVDYDNKRYILDPRGPVEADFTFVSHAHLDHVHQPRKDERILTSRETQQLAQARGFDLGRTIEEVEGVDLLDSGHILGSRAIRIADEVLYTGDAAGRERAFLGKCRTRRARALIMETTYGSPEYLFPSPAKLVKEVHTLISETFDKGKPVVLMGYPLGKAQLLTYFFSTWSPFYVHESVARMNEIHRRNGVDLKRGKVVDPTAVGDGDISRGPWLMVAPMMSSSNRFLARLKKEHSAVTVAFSGWATNDGYRFSMGADYAFPLSDHCDYAELMKLVQEVSPEVVYTTHGFAQEFAADLRRVGFTARTISSYQSSLFDYLKGD